VLAERLTAARMSSPILKLIAQRVALGLLLLLAVSVLIFAGTQILPGDVAQSILGQSATPQALANLREELGLNAPAYVRYFRWLGGVLTGDLGTALSSRQDIATAIGGRLWNTLFLAFWAAIVSIPLAIILGLLAVRYRNGWIDKTISGLAYIETAELKGLSAFEIIRKHAFPNAIAPVINVVMLNLAFLIVGVVVIEVIFVYPGMGQYLVDHVAKRDVPVVQAVGLIFAAVYIGLNIIADIAAIVANPRLRHPK
jgi:peptide/nickel transport system permease protein